MNQDKISWPTKALEKAISKYDLNDYPVDMFLMCNEINDRYEADAVINRFAPRVYTTDFGLYLEKRTIFGGVFVRALEDRGKEKRCIQYLYVYTRQNGVVSYFWNIFLPLLLTFWGFLILRILPNMLQPDNLLVQFSVLMLMVPLIPFLQPLLTHYYDFIEGKPFSVQSTTLLPILLCLEILFLFSIFAALLTFWIVAIVFSIIKIAEEFGMMPSSHPMDYVPVFVYLKKTDGRWSFDYALWDRWHYDTGSTRNVFDIFRIIEKSSNYERIPLTIDNSWHSMQLGEPKKSKWAIISLPISLIVLLISMLDTNLIILAQDILYPYGSLYFPVVCLIFIYSFMALLRYPQGLVTTLQDFRKNAMPLTPEKLRVFWNLGKEKKPSRIKKIQRALASRFLKSKLISLQKRVAKSVRRRGIDFRAIPPEWYPLDKILESLNKNFNFEDPREDLTKYERVDDTPSLKIVYKMQDPFDYYSWRSGFFDSFRDSPRHIFPLLNTFAKEATSEAVSEVMSEAMRRFETHTQLPEKYSVTDEMKDLYQLMISSEDSEPDDDNDEDRLTP